MAKVAHAEADVQITVNDSALDRAIQKAETLESLLSKLNGTKVKLDIDTGNANLTKQQLTGLKNNLQNLSKTADSIGTKVNKSLDRSVQKALGNIAKTGQGITTATAAQLGTTAYPALGTSASYGAEVMRMGFASGLDMESLFTGLGYNPYKALTTNVDEALNGLTQNIEDTSKGLIPLNRSIDNTTKANNEASKSTGQFIETVSGGTTQTPQQNVRQIGTGTSSSRTSSSSGRTTSSRTSTSGGGGGSGPNGPFESSSGTTYSNKAVKDFFNQAAQEIGLSVSRATVKGDTATLKFTDGMRENTATLTNLTDLIEGRGIAGKSAYAGGAFMPDFINSLGIFSESELLNNFARSQAGMSRQAKLLEQLTTTEGSSFYNGKNANILENLFGRYSNVQGVKDYAQAITSGMQSFTMKTGLAFPTNVKDQFAQMDSAFAGTAKSIEVLRKQGMGMIAELSDSNRFKQKETTTSRFGGAQQERSGWLSEQEKQIKTTADLLASGILPEGTKKFSDTLKTLNKAVGNVTREYNAEEKAMKGTRILSADQTNGTIEDVLGYQTSQIKAANQGNRRTRARGFSYSQNGENDYTITYDQGNQKKQQRVYKETYNGEDRWYAQDLGSIKGTTATQDWFSSLGNRVRTFVEGFSSMYLMSAGIQQFRNGVDFVKSMDKSLTNIGMTMGVTSAELDELGESAIQTGKELSTDSTNVLSAMTVYANAGENAASIAQKSKYAVMLSNATGLGTDVTADMLQGATAQFGVSEEEVINSFEKISSELPLDFAKGIQGMSDAISNAGSVAHESGLSMQEFAAITGEVAAVTRQEGSQIGNTLKTTMARISRSKSADEEVSGKDRSNAAAAYKEVLGYDLFDSNGEYKDLSETLDTLAGSWGNLTDAEKNYIAEQSAGTRGLNVFRTMMDNWGEIQRLTNGAMSDSGMADRVQETYDNSLLGKSEKLKATYQDLFNDVLSSDTLGFITDTISGSVDVLGKLSGTAKGVVKGATGWLGDGVSNFLGGAAGAATIGSMLFSAFRTGKAYKNDDVKGLGEALGVGFAPFVEPFMDAMDFFKKRRTNNALSGQLEQLGEIGGDTTRAALQRLNISEGSKGWLGKLLEESTDLSFSGLKDSFVEGFSSLFKGIKPSEVFQEAGGLNKLASGLGYFALPAAAAGMGIWAFRDINKAPQESIDYANNLYSQQQSKQQTYKAARSFYDQNAGVYSDLAKGVNVRTNENISLTNDEYQRYLDLTNQIADQFPSLVRGFDDEGNAVLNTSNAVADMNDSLRTTALNNAYDNLSNGKDYAEAFRYNYDTGYHGTSGWGGLATTIHESWNDFVDNLNNLGGKGTTSSKRGSLFGNIEALSNLNDLFEINGEAFNYQNLSEMLNRAGLISGGQKARASEYYDDLGFEAMRGLAEGSPEMYAAQKQVKQNIKTLQDTLNLEADSNMNMIRTLMDSQADIMRYSDAYDFGNLSDRDWNNLGAVLESTSFDQMMDMIQKNPGKTVDKLATEYASRWANALQSAGKDSEFSNALNDLLTLNGGSSFSDLRRALGHDIETIRDVMPSLNMDLFKESLGLDDVQQTLNTFDKITDRLKRSDSLMSSISESGSNWNRKLEDFGSASEAFDARLESFLDSRGINSADAINTYAAAVESLGDRVNSMDWSDLESYLDVRGFNSDAFAERVDMIKANVDTIRESQAAISELTTTSRGATGLDTSSIEQLADTYSQIEGFDSSKLFEFTGTGVRTNDNYLNYLNGQLKQIKEGEYDQYLKDTQEQLVNFDKMIATTPAGAERDEMIAERDFVLSGLEDIRAANAQIEALFSDTNQLLTTRSIGESGAVYDAIAEIFSPKLNSKGEISSPAEIEHLYNTGFIGSDEFRKAVQLMTPADVTDLGLDQLVDLYNQNNENFRALFDSNDLQGAMEYGKQKLADAGLIEEGASTWINGVEKTTGKVVGNITDIANALGISEDAAQTFVDKIDDYGYSWSNPIDETTEALTDLHKSAQDAVGKSPLFSDVNLGVNSLEEANKQLETLNKHQQEAQNQGLGQEYEAIEDYLTAKKGSYLTEKNAAGLKEAGVTDDQITQLDSFRKKLEQIRDVDVDQGLEKIDSLRKKYSDINFDEIKDWGVDDLVNNLSKMSTADIESLLDAFNIHVDASELEALIGLIDEANSKKQELEKETKVKTTASEDDSTRLDTVDDVKKAINDNRIDAPGAYNEKVYNPKNLVNLTVKEAREKLAADYQQAYNEYADYVEHGNYSANPITQDLILQDKLQKGQPIQKATSVQQAFERGYISGLDNVDLGGINYRALTNYNANQLQGVADWLAGGKFKLPTNTEQRLGVEQYKANSQEQFISAGEIQEAVKNGIIHAPEGMNLSDKSLNGMNFDQYVGKTAQQIEAALRENYTTKDQQSMQQPAGDLKDSAGNLNNAAQSLQKTSQSQQESEESSSKKSSSKKSAAKEEESEEETPKTTKKTYDKNKSAKDQGYTLGDFFGDLFGGAGKWLQDHFGPTTAKASEYEDGELAGEYKTAQHVHELGKKSTADQTKGFREIEGGEVEVDAKVNKVDKSSLKEAGEGEELEVDAKVKDVDKTSLQNIGDGNEINLDAKVGDIDKASLQNIGKDNTIEVDAKVGDIDKASLQNIGREGEIEVNAKVGDIDTAKLQNIGKDGEIEVNAKVGNVDTANLQNLGDDSEMTINAKVGAVDTSNIQNAAGAEMTVNAKVGSVDTSTINNASGGEITVNAKVGSVDDSSIKALDGSTVTINAEVKEGNFDSFIEAKENSIVNVKVEVSNADMGELENVDKTLDVTAKVTDVDTAGLDSLKSQTIDVEGQVNWKSNDIEKPDIPDATGYVVYHSREVVPPDIPDQVGWVTYHSRSVEAEIPDQVGWVDFHTRSVDANIPDQVGWVTWHTRGVQADIPQQVGFVKWYTATVEANIPPQTGFVNYHTGSVDANIPDAVGWVNWHTASVDTNIPPAVGFVNWQTGTVAPPPNEVATGYVNWVTGQEVVYTPRRTGYVDWVTGQEVVYNPRTTGYVDWVTGAEVSYHPTTTGTVNWVNGSGPSKASGTAFVQGSVLTSRGAVNNNQTYNTTTITRGGPALWTGSALAKGTVENEEDDEKKKNIFTSFMDRLTAYRKRSGKEPDNAGTAQAKGNWGLKRSGINLVGELGRELVVRGSRWFTIGDNGAEMRQLQKGDIVFNHLQTEEIFKKGRAISGGGRGKRIGGALAQGTALDNGTKFPIPHSLYEEFNWPHRIWDNFDLGILPDFSPDYDRDRSYKQFFAEVDMNSFVKSITNATQGLNVARGAAVDMSHAFEDNVTTFDYVEQAITRLGQKMNNTDTLFSNTFMNIPQRIDYGAEKYQLLIDQANMELEARNKYWEAARAIGLDENTMTLAKEGSIDIQNVQDKDLAKRITEFTKYYNQGREAESKMMQTQNEINEHLLNLVELRMTPYDQYTQGFEKQAQQDQNKIDIVESKGHFASSLYYENLYDSRRMQQAAMEAQIAVRNQLFDQMVAEGRLQVGSQEYNDELLALQEMNIEWQNITKSCYEAKQAGYEANQAIFEYSMNQIDNIHKENDFIRQVIGAFEEDLFADLTGRFNINGATVAGTHALDYSIYMKQADDYAKKAEEIKRQLEDDRFNTGMVNTTLLDQYNKYHQAQQESIANALEEKRAIQDLYRNQYDHMLDILDKVITKKKEQLEAEKDLYDYQKKVQDQVDDINELQKIYLSLQNDDSEEGKARRQEVKNDLDEAQEDLEETEYTQWLTDQERIMDDYYSAAEETFNARLNEVEMLLEQANGFLTSNYESLQYITAENENDRMMLQAAEEQWIGLMENNIDYTLEQYGATLDQQTHSLYENLFSPALANMQDSTMLLKNAMDIVATNIGQYTQQLQHLTVQNNPMSMHPDAYGYTTNEPNRQTNPALNETNYQNAKAAANQPQQTVQQPAAQPANNGGYGVGIVPNALVTPIDYAQIFESPGGACHKPYFKGSNPDGSYYGPEDQKYYVIRNEGEYSLVSWYKSGGGITGWFLTRELKLAQYANGGYTGDKEGIAYLHPQEMILNQRQFSNFSRLTELIPLVVDQFRKNSILGTVTDNLLDKVKTESTSNNSTSNNTFEFNITMNDVQNPEQFANELRRSREFQQVIADITESKLTNNNTLGVRKGMRAIR